MIRKTGFLFPFYSFTSIYNNMWDAEGNLRAPLLANEKGVKKESDSSFKVSRINNLITNMQEIGSELNMCDRIFSDIRFCLLQGSGH